MMTKVLTKKDHYIKYHNVDKGNHKTRNKKQEKILLLYLIDHNVKKLKQKTLFVSFLT